jgi:hypothetical protein
MTMPPETAYWGVVLKQLLLGLSAFSIGVMLYRSLFYERRRQRPFLATGYIGMALLLGVIAELVVRAPLVNPDARALLYTTGVALTGIGFLGDAIVGQRRARIARRRATQRVTDLEDRVTAEEARNTDIEGFAAATKERADVSEARADAAEARADEHGEARTEEHERKEKKR